MNKKLMLFAAVSPLMCVSVAGNSLAFDEKDAAKITKIKEIKEVKYLNHGEEKWIYLSGNAVLLIGKLTKNSLQRAMLPSESQKNYEYKKNDDEENSEPETKLISTNEEDYFYKNISQTIIDKYIFKVLESELRSLNLLQNRFNIPVAKVLNNPQFKPVKINCIEKPDLICPGFYEKYYDEEAGWKEFADDEELVGQIQNLSSDIDELGENGWSVGREKNAKVLTKLIQDSIRIFRIIINENLDVPDFQGLLNTKTGEVIIADPGNVTVAANGLSDEIKEIYDEAINQLEEISNKSKFLIWNKKILK